MDNKKWGSRFSTIFWWSLTILPLIIALIYFIGYHLTFNSGITTATDLIVYHKSSDGSFLYYLNNIFTEQGNFTFNTWSIYYFRIMFSSLFTNLGVTYGVTLARLFAWMTSVVFYHLLFDFIVWLPRWFHKIMGKGFDDLK